jgi:hypothetical protein
MGDRLQQLRPHLPTPKLLPVQRFQKVQLHLCTFQAKLKSIFSAAVNNTSPRQEFSPENFLCKFFTCDLPPEVVPYFTESHIQQP